MQDNTQKVITADTLLVTCTVGDVLDFVKKNIVGLVVPSTERNYSESDMPKDYWSIKQLMDHFGISYGTAMKWKKTFMKDAVDKVGNKLQFDKKKALALYEQECARNRRSMNF